nr:hypothetical protein Iba_chr07dCG6540 [Ipomoea batatas]
MFPAIFTASRVKRTSSCSAQLSFRVSSQAGKFTGDICGLIDTKDLLGNVFCSSELSRNPNRHRPPRGSEDCCRYRGLTSIGFSISGFQSGSS